LTLQLLLLPDKKSSSAFIGRLKKSWSSYYFERAVFLYKHHSINYYVSDQDIFTLAVPVLLKQCSNDYIQANANNRKSSTGQQ